MIMILLRWKVDITSATFALLALSSSTINNNTVPAGGPGPRAFTCQMNFQVTVNVDYRLYFYTSFQTRFQIIHDQVVFPSE